MVDFPPSLAVHGLGGQSGDELLLADPPGLDRQSLGGLSVHVANRDGALGCVVFHLGSLLPS